MTVMNGVSQEFPIVCSVETFRNGLQNGIVNLLNIGALVYLHGRPAYVLTSQSLRAACCNHRFFPCCKHLCVCLCVPEFCVCVCVVFSSCTNIPVSRENGHPKFGNPRPHIYIRRNGDPVPIYTHGQLCYSPNDSMGTQNSTKQPHGLKATPVKIRLPDTLILAFLIQQEMLFEAVCMRYPNNRYTASVRLVRALNIFGGAKTLASRLHTERVHSLDQAHNPDCGIINASVMTP